VRINRGEPQACRIRFVGSLRTSLVPPGRRIARWSLLEAMAAAVSRDAPRRVEGTPEAIDQWRRRTSSPNRGNPTRRRNKSKPLVTGNSIGKTMAEAAATRHGEQFKRSGVVTKTRRTVSPDFGGVRVNRPVRNRLHCAGFVDADFAAQPNA